MDDMDNDKDMIEFETFAEWVEAMESNFGQSEQNNE